ncbi:MAG: NAD(P)H-dependent glycerol-3-phosphate dehydrogenase [Acidaminococcaceae bacterium]
MNKKIAIIGAGSWGTTLAQILDDNGHEVTLWVRKPTRAQTIKSTRYNSDYLPAIKLAPSIQITADLNAAVQVASILVLVVPSHGMQTICQQISANNSCANKTIISCTKGFALDTGQRMSEIIHSTLPAATLAVLSGPNHAEEIALRQPSATVIACADLKLAEKLQQLFLNAYFRPYITDDLIGVEVAGSLKNIIALTSGIMFGLGFGDNSQAALITRGLAEITRLGVALGARRETFSGLAGVGDLIATCTSSHSRNRRAGEALARGETLTTIATSTHMVIEGINATKAAYALQQTHRVEMPITESLAQILFAGKNVQTALKELMNRSGKQELLK